MDAALTKEGIEVRQGQIWEDLDKRMSGRRCVVIAVNGGQAIMQHEHGWRQTKVAIRRMHKSSTGWRLVK